MNLTALDRESRLLLQVPLAPQQGTRFQPTGFPDLGPAEYRSAEDVPMVLVESPQSMANRLEMACWDDAKNHWIPALDGLPYVRINQADGSLLTTSVLEAHRLNSPYILEGKSNEFADKLKEELQIGDKQRPDLRILARVLAKYDPNCLLHGVFLAKKDIAGGRMRLPRALSSFIEASHVATAESGGVKRDDVDPSGSAKEGFGHVPFHRTEFTGKLNAYFSLDLAQIRGYSLGDAMSRLLTAWALYKIQLVLRDGLRLRTACDLSPSGPLAVTRPEGFAVPTIAELEAALPSLVSEASTYFADPRVTDVNFETK